MKFFIAIFLHNNTNIYILFILFKFLLNKIMLKLKDGLRCQFVSFETLVFFLSCFGKKKTI